MLSLISMKKFRLILFTVSYAFAMHTANCQNDKPSVSNFKEYPDYFVMNSYTIENSQEFMILNDSASFDQVFHPAAVMKKQVWMEPSAFKDKVAIGIIREFNNVCSCPEMKITSIELVNKTIVYRYNITGNINTGDLNCNMSCRPNLLVMVDRNSFTSIDFYENDKLVKRLNKK